MWAEWKAGQELRGVERSPGGRPEKNPTQAGWSFSAVIKNYDLPKTTAYRWITMSFASREEVERRASCRHRTESSRVS
jgi:hypothetical protein